MRRSYIDTLKLFAVFIIYVGHFVSNIHSEYMSYFNRGTEITILNGVTGKLGVSFFCICLGYFAFLSTEKNPTIYMLRRYFYFFFCGLFINVLYNFYNILERYQGFGFLNILQTSLRLGNQIYGPYWCAVPFFISSVLCYINRKTKISCIGILFQIVFLYMIDQVWIAICLLGAVTAIILNNNIQIFNYRVVRITALIMIFFAIKRPECKTTFFVDGLSSAILFLVVENSDFLKKALSIPFLTSMGKNSMAIFLTHPLIFTILGRVLMKIYSIPYGIRFLAVLLVCWCVTVGLSYPITWFINKVTNSFNQYITKFSEAI